MSTLGNVVAWSCDGGWNDEIWFNDEEFAAAYSEADAHVVVTRHNAEVAALQARIAELEKDKDRLDWMEKQGMIGINHSQYGEYSFYAGEAYPPLREVIDAARI